MHPLPHLRAVTAALVAVLLAGACSDASQRPRTQASISGVLLDRQLGEISGIAASHRHRDVLWAIDDGGNPARLFALDTHGRRRATFSVEGVTKTDWEDLAGFEQAGTRYLLVADTGDNGGLRRTLQLHVLREPTRLANARIRPAWSIAFRWPDGARDCEAIAVDARRGQVLLVSKKRYPPELFTVPLRPAHGVQVARRVGTLAGVPMPPPSRNGRRAVDSHVTAAALSPDGQTFAVMTYRHLLRYRRGTGRWAAAIAKPLPVQRLPWLPQAEALAWSADGRWLYATGEFVPAPLYRIDATR